ncbi:hypothetical protein [Exiguobacterium sp. s155]|uniref:hypothetical protein n=1 Tax=Exiguobacterium sp. s155 TaxID=2751286 RepID=UPI001BE8F51F|nr:hypothetical protein [Exiguobacterium sp. s155]
MFHKFQYRDEQERRDLIERHPNLFLIEEQNVEEGNFLIFSEKPTPVQIVYTQISADEIEALKAENQALNTAVVELYEIVLGGS